MPAPESNIPRHQMLTPENRKVSDRYILCWARDMEEAGDILGGFEQDVEEAKRQLEEAEVASFAKEGL